MKPNSDQPLFLTLRTAWRTSVQDRLRQSTVWTYLQARTTKARKRSASGSGCDGDCNAECSVASKTTKKKTRDTCPRPWLYLQYLERKTRRKVTASEDLDWTMEMTMRFNAFEVGKLIHDSLPSRARALGTPKHVRFEPEVQVRTYQYIPANTRKNSQQAIKAPQLMLLSPPPEPSATFPLALQHNISSSILFVLNKNKVDTFTEKPDSSDINTGHSTIFEIKKKAMMTMMVPAKPALRKKSKKKKKMLTRQKLKLKLKHPRRKKINKRKKGNRTSHATTYVPVPKFVQDWKEMPDELYTQCSLVSTATQT